LQSHAERVGREVSHRPALHVHVRPDDIADHAVAQEAATGAGRLRAIERADSHECSTAASTLVSLMDGFLVNPTFSNGAMSGRAGPSRG
jgi:hypothetical protein